MAKIQSKNSSTKSTKLGTSAPKAPSFTKEQSAYVAGLLTGRGMGASGGGSPHMAAFMPVSGDVYDPSAQTIRQQQQAEMQKDIDQTVVQNIANQESAAARYRSIANEVPLLDPVDPRQAQANAVALEREQNPTGYLPKYGQNSPFAAQARDPATTDPPEDLIAIWPWLKKVINGEPTQVPTGPVELPQEVQPGLDEYGMAMQAMRQSESDAQARALQSIRGTEVYDPALSRGVTKHISQGPPIDYQPNLMERFLDTIDPVLSGKAFKEQNERYSVDPAKVGEVDMISSATNTVSAARDSKINPAKGKIETPADAATYWATELPAWLKPKIAYDENNEPYVTMHAAVMQRMMIASMYGGMAQNSRNNADRIEQEAMQGVSPEVVQGTHDAQYTINQLAQNAPRGTQHTGPYGYGQQQYAVTTAQGDPYEASFVKMLQQQYPQLTTAEILRILRGQ